MDRIIMSSDRFLQRFADAIEQQALLSAGECMLVFSQYSQSYRMFCTVTNLTPADPAFEATYWHNRLFNPTLPGNVQVLCFTPRLQESG